MKSRKVGGVLIYYQIDFINNFWKNAKGDTDGTPIDNGGNIFSDPIFNTDYTLQS